jgi:hypothetical protein
MRMLIRPLVLFLLAGFLAPVQAATATSPHAGAGPNSRRELMEAMGAAEAETGGEAVTARRVAMTGTASPEGLDGIEVLVHMPDAKQGWRCLIGSTNMRLRSKERILNPKVR